MEKIENSYTGPRSVENATEQIITHDGLFHADEVFADAILEDLLPQYMKVGVADRVKYVDRIRTREQEVLKDAMIAKNKMLLDVGGKYNFDLSNLDHHQQGGAGKRENGISYAAAGLVWKHYGKEWIDYVEQYTRLAKHDSDEEAEQNRIENGEKPSIDPKVLIEKNTGIERENISQKLSEDEKQLIWEQMDKNFIQFLDANDTGDLQAVTCSLANGTEISGFQFTLPEIVRTANIESHDGRSHYKRFKDTVELFRMISYSIANKYIDIVEGMRGFDMGKCQFSSDKKTVVIDQVLPPAVYSFIVANKPEFADVEYYATLNIKNEYSVMVAPISEGARDYRNPNAIPKNIRVGNKTSDVNKTLGVNGVSFIHTAGFFANCKDRESAQKLIDYCVHYN